MIKKNPLNILKHNIPNDIIEIRPYLLRMNATRYIMIHILNPIVRKKCQWFFLSISAYFNFNKWQLSYYTSDVKSIQGAEALTTDTP